MEKHILAHELAELVIGLLVSPDRLGELDTDEKHKAFMLDIGRVVASHCGGIAANVSPAQCILENDTEFENTPSLVVLPNEELPDVHRNVWSNYDTLAWNTEHSLVDENGFGRTLCERVTKSRRSELQSLLCNKGLDENISQRMRLKALDWRWGHDDVLSDRERESLSLASYSMEVHIGNQSGIEFMDSCGEPVVGLAIEINHGVPAFHFDVNGGDSILHIQVAKDGLVITPGNSDVAFKSPDSGVDVYDDPRSMVCR